MRLGDRLHPFAAVAWLLWPVGKTTAWSILTRAS
jgi:hypothetical protein